MPPCKDENVSMESSPLPKLVAPQADAWKFRIGYFNTMLFSYYHAAGLYGLYLCFTSARWPTILFAAILLEASIVGALAGAHRLWSHRSFKAKLPLQLILILFQTLSGQNTVFTWVREHRLHHRHSDTDADPHNASRGLFFSHIGWMLVHKHPEVIRRGASTDMSDIVSNPLLAFQKRHALILFTLICYVIPSAIPMYFWGETLDNAWNVNITRFVFCLTFTSLINSAAHTFGNRPYDKDIVATQNLAVSICTLGEGFHNYHHTFPQDYRAGELGDWFNFSKSFIDFFAWIGWAYDLKTVDKKTIVNRAMKSGDGTYSWNSDHTLTGEIEQPPATHVD